MRASAARRLDQRKLVGEKPETIRERKDREVRHDESRNSVPSS